MQFGKIKVDGINIFYRTTGKQGKPTLVLFHGFPSASHMFRDLMPMLEDDFYMIAPDYPGFGQSDAPDRAAFSYTFGHIADIMEAFLEQIALESRCGEIAEYIKRWLKKTNK